MTWIRRKPGTNETRRRRFITRMPEATTIRSTAVGMTLLELMVACSILIVLATAAIPLVRVSVARHREAALRYDLRQMRDAIDRYKDAADKNLIQAQAGTEGYPPDLQTLVTGVSLTSATGQKVHFLRHSKNLRCRHGRFFGEVTETRIPNDAVTNGQMFDLAPYLEHFAASFHTGNDGERRLVLIFVRNHQGVGEIHGSSANGNSHLVRTRQPSGHVH